jgi:beta-glucosidase
MLLPPLRLRRSGPFLFSLTLWGVFAFALSGCSEDIPETSVQPGDGDGNTGDGDTPGDGDGSGGGDGDGTGGFGAGASGSGGSPSGAGGDGSGGQVGTGGGVTQIGDFELPIVDWPSAECETQVSALLSQMSNEAKAAQMVMGVGDDGSFSKVSTADVTAGSVGTIFISGDGLVGSSSPADYASLVDGYISASAASPNALPILFGVDAVHGNSKVTGTVLFPHNIGLGCTGNPELVEEIGRITALEMAATGISWTFGPVFSVSHDDRWGRAFESYSEDPVDVAMYGGAQVVGLQGRGGLGSGSLGSGSPGVIACAKHFAADGQATYGTSWRAAEGGLVDRGDVAISEADMRKYGIDPYIPAIRAGLGSIMVSDTTWNGQNMTGHAELITTILKEELGFQGFVTTDWEASSRDTVGGVVGAIGAGVDLLMEPGEWESVRGEIVAAAGTTIPQARIDDAVRRILTVKCEAGLFGWSRDAALLSEVGSPAHREVGRQAVRESLVLLAHANGVLPLSPSSNIWLAGSGADSLTRQAGGWTINWQGDGNATEGTTILEAVSSVATVVPEVADADVALVVLSENPYAEWQGDVSSLDTISAADFALLSEAREAGKPVVALILSGRPVLITDHLESADAWIAAWLPGTEGQGIVDVLFGDHNFTGKLSHSWPETEEQANQNKDDPGFSPLFPYGHGLTY